MNKLYVSLKPGDEVLCPEGHLTITGRTGNCFTADKYYWDPDEDDCTSYTPVKTDEHLILTEYELVNQINAYRSGEPRYDKIKWEE